VIPLLLTFAQAAPPPSDAPPWWFVASVLTGVIGVGLFTLRMALKRSRRSKGEPCASCGRQSMPGWTRCLFCGAAIGSSGGPAGLEFLSGPLTGQKVSLDRDVTTIGSVDGNTVLLNDTGVSRKHVGIRRVKGGYELADLGSTNGVYVNGEKVARRRLTVGDVIRVGTTEIAFRA
jgi:hypothetical protein